MDSISATIATVIGILVIIAWSFIVRDCTRYCVDDTWRDIIANKGCAEYYLDDKHQRQWRWK